jgi:hypothetical protein
MFKFPETVNFGTTILTESTFVLVESLAKIGLKIDIKVIVSRIVFMAKIYIRLMIQICTFLMPEINTNKFVFLCNSLIISYLKRKKSLFEESSFCNYYEVMMFLISCIRTIIIIQFPNDAS